MIFFRSCNFILRRMLRGYLGLIILIVLPLSLITVLGLVAGDAVDEQLGLSYMDMIAVTMIVSFQLFGGFYSLEFVRDDLFSARKWRMNALPYPASLHALSTFVTATFFSFLQGLTLVLFTRWVHGVNWGNMGLVLIAILAVGLLSQLVLLLLVLGVKNPKLGERLGEVYGFGSMLLAGVWFNLPDVGFLNFMSTYGNPISLGRMAIVAAMSGTHMDKGMLSLGILFTASAVLAFIAILIGRRKLA